MVLAGRGGAGGWYPDPIGRYPKRYWDGSAWTASVLDGQNHIAVDYLGSPVDAPAPLTQTGPKSLSSRRSLIWPIVGAVGLAAAVLVAAIVISDQRATDHTDDALASQASEMSDVSDSIGDVEDSISDLESDVSELSEGESFDFSEFVELEPPFDACDLLTPGDVQTVLGVDVTRDHDLSFEPYVCVFSTPASPEGTAVEVLGDTMFAGDDLKDSIEYMVPGGADSLTAVEIGDEGYVTLAFGAGYAAAAVDDAYVVITVLRGGLVTTPEQLTELLKIAVSHM